MDKDQATKPRKIIKKPASGSGEGVKKSPEQIAAEERVKMQKLIRSRQRAALVKFIKSIKDALVNSINYYGFFYRKNFRAKNPIEKTKGDSFDVNGFVARMQQSQNMQTEYSSLRQKMESIIDNADIEIKIPPSSVLKNWFFETLKRSQPKKLFAIPDPDIEPRIGMQKSVIFHLVVLVIALLPFDMLFKTKKPSKVKITVIQRGVQSGMGSTVMTDESKKDAQAPTKDQDAMATELAKIETAPLEQKIETPPKKPDIVKPEPKSEPAKPQAKPDTSKQDAKKLQETMALLEQSTKNLPIAKKLDDKKQPDKKIPEKPIKPEPKPEPVKPQAKPDTSKQDAKPQTKNETSAIKKNTDPDAKIGNENRAATVERNTIMDKFADAGSVNGITQGEKRGGIANERNIIAANFYKCWVATNVLNTMPKNISVDAVVYLDIDGNVSNYKIIDKSYPTDYENMQYNKAKDSAVYAINTCNKVAGLDKTRYSVWQKVELNFKYSKLNQ